MGGSPFPRCRDRKAQHLATFPDAELCRNCHHEAGLHTRQATNDVCNGANPAWSGSCTCPTYQPFAYEVCPNHDFGTCDSYGCTFAKEAERES